MPAPASQRRRSPSTLPKRALVSRIFLFQRNKAGALQGRTLSSVPAAQREAFTAGVIQDSAGGRVIRGRARIIKFWASYDPDSLWQPRGRKENWLFRPHEAGGHAHARKSGRAH